MSNAIEFLVKHPIRTSIVITTITSGVVRIIATLKGKDVQPAFTIKIDDNLTFKKGS